MKTFVCAVDLEFWSHEPLLWIIIASKDLIWNMSYVRNMLWYFFKNKKSNIIKVHFFLNFFFNTYYFFIRHNFMYLAQYNTFCSEKKICVCVGGGVGILMNYLIFGNTWWYRFQLGKCAFYEFFSTFYSIYWRCLWRDKQTSMHNNVHYPP